MVHATSSIIYLWQGRVRHRPYLTFIMSTQPVVHGLKMASVLKPCMTKGTILRIFWIFVLTCNAYNLESIATTDFKFGVMILISSCYICKHKMWWSSNMIDLCTLPDQTGSGCGPDFPQFGSSPFGTGGLLQLLTLDLWSRSPKLSKYQVGGLGLLWPWNGDSLKTAIWSLFSYPTTYIYKFNTEVIR